MPITLRRSTTACCCGLLLALLVLAGPAAAADFDVRTANLRRTPGAWTLTARIDYRLTPKAVEALENGVPLTFSVELSVSRVRGWWPDPEVLETTLERELGYDALTKRYLVRYGDGREPSSHATLFGALNALGRLQGVPVGDANALDEAQVYDVAVRAVLDQQTLPGPLQVIDFWSGGFSLESDWYEWTMRP